MDREIYFTPSSSVAQRALVVQKVFIGTMLGLLIRFVFGTRRTAVRLNMPTFWYVVNTVTPIHRYTAYTVTPFVIGHFGFYFVKTNGRSSLHAITPWYLLLPLPLHRYTVTPLHRYIVTPLYRIFRYTEIK